MKSDNNKELSEPSDDDKGDDDPHHKLIPPYLPDQTVFTRSLKQQKSTAAGNSSSSQQQQQQQQQEEKERYFEAVIRKVRHHPNMGDDKEASWSFLIHFKGWNARHDRWIAASQLLPDTPETRQQYDDQQQEEELQKQAEVEAQKQKQLRKQQRKKDLAAAKASSNSATSSQQQQSTNNNDPAFLASSILPFTLKTVMVEEWEKITRRGYDAPFGLDDEDILRSRPKATGPARSVHSLPSAVTIRQLLKHFEKKTRKQWKQKQEKAAAVAAGEDNDETLATAAATILTEEASNKFKLEVRQFCQGLGRLFEEALPVCLLYPQERPQYQYYIHQRQQQQKQKQQGESVSALDVYGCEFLLRLIVRLPHLSPRNPLPPLMTDLIVLLQQNRPACFKGKFRPPRYPHEWLEWERDYYGDPSATKRNGKAAAARNNQQQDKRQRSSEQED